MDFFKPNNFKFYQDFSVSHKIYAFAFLMQIIYFFTDMLAYSTIGFVAIIAMAMELWPRFVASWNSLFGRFVIIVSYAIVANFAVAFAAQKLNEVIGVDPSPLFYSIGFASLMMAPIWMLALSAFVMVIYTLFLQAVILFKIILKVLRIEQFVPIKSQKNGLKFALVKLILIPAMFSTLIASIEYYGGEISQPKFVDKQFNFNPLTDEKNAQQANVPAVQSLNEKVSAATTNNDVGFKVKQPQAVEAEVKTGENNSATFNQIIALFVHHVELFKFSQCIKTEQERVLFIGEFDILVSEPDPTHPNKFKFSVRNCQLKNYQ